MKSKSSVGFIRRYFPLFLKRLVAALVALFVIAFVVVGLTLIIFPSPILAAGLILIAVSFILSTYFALRLILYPPRSRVQHGPADYGFSHWEDVGFRAADGVAIGAWYIAPGSQTEGAALVFLHGLGGNRGELLRVAAMVAAHGYGALVLDLRNHGRSENALTTLGYREVEDVWGAVAYLLSRQDVNSERIGVFGYSMGAAAALSAAAQFSQIRAVVAQSAFTSLDENLRAGVTAQLGLPPFPFVSLITWMGERTANVRVKQVRPIDDVAKISPRAVLFIHGMRDGYVSAENSQRLYDAAREPKELYLISRADHKVLIDVDPREYENRVITFLERYLLGKPPQNEPSGALGAPPD